MSILPPWLTEEHVDTENVDPQEEPTQEDAAALAQSVDQDIKDALQDIRDVFEDLLILLEEMLTMPTSI